MDIKRLWIALSTVIIGSFAVLGYFGVEIYHQAPPIPARVLAADGQVIFTGEEIKLGQNAWQSMGGQEVGTVWGHGAYVAPDWSADWLHREASWLLDEWAREDHGQKLEALPAETQTALKERLRQELRRNTYDATTDDILVSPIRTKAIAAVGGHYSALFGDDFALKELRSAYAIPPNTIKTPEWRKGNQRVLLLEILGVRDRANHCISQLSSPTPVAELKAPRCC